MCPTVGGGVAGGLVAAGGVAAGGSATVGGGVGGGTAGGAIGGGAAGGALGGGTAGGHSTDGGVTCSAIQCGQHGSCDAGGCECATGYSGTTCTQCAAGFQDNDRDGTCTESCAAVDAGCVRGACVDDGGTAVCACVGGYVGAMCSACASGLQDNDNDGVCAPSCTPATCNGHGTCSDLTGAAACTCTGGFTLPTCSSCAPGLQDNDGNGTCSASCDAGLSCQAFSSCSDSTGLATCVCVTGFAPDAGACMWSGVVADPDFRSVAPRWTTIGELQLSPFEGTSLGIGAARCDGGCFDTSTAPGVRQTVSMPPATVNLAFALQGRVAQPTAVRLGAALVGLSNGSSSQCLGEAAFVTAQPLSALSWLTAHQAPYSTTIDFLDISPEPRCPMPGAVLNGDFETLNVNGIAGYLGWTGENQTLQIATAGVVNGSRAGRLSTFNCAPRAALQTMVSVPAALLNPALRFQVRRTASNPHESRVLVRTKELTLGSFIVPSSGSTTVCLGAWTRGQSIPVAFSAFVAPGVAFSSPCHTPLPSSEVQLDEVSLVSDPSCVAPIEDPGFEGPDAGTGWVTSPGFSPAFGSSAGVSFPRGSDAGHLSQTSAALTVTSGCGDTTLERTVQPPAMDGGVALRFWYRADGEARVWLSPWVRDGGASLQLTSTQSWTPTVLCVPRGLEGLPYNLRFTAEDAVSGGCLPFAGSASTLSIDDVEFVSAPSCASGTGTPGTCSLASPNCPAGEACMLADVSQTACFAGACQLVAQDCGSGLRCDYSQQPDGGVARACLPAGANLAEGATCDRGLAACAAGLTCLPGLDGGSTCWRYCNTTADCSGPRQCVAQIAFGSNGERARLCF